MGVLEAGRGWVPGQKWVFLLVGLLLLPRHDMAECGAITPEYLTSEGIKWSNFLSPDKEKLRDLVQSKKCPHTTGAI